MYARILRNPAKYEYPELPAGVVKQPKFGHVYVELRVPSERRPKLVDGLDWVPSSTANASRRLLRDGKTELLRYYCARRTKSEAAKPMEKPFVTFQREVYMETKSNSPRADTYGLKKEIGERWRAMSDDERSVYVQRARTNNRTIRSRMSGADPSELLVRHEMWLYEVGKEKADTGQLQRVLVHYLGDDAFQLMNLPPRAMRVIDDGRAQVRTSAERDRQTDMPEAGCAARHHNGEEDPNDNSSGATEARCHEGSNTEEVGSEYARDRADSASDPFPLYSIPSTVETARIHLFIGCFALSPADHENTETGRDDNEPGTPTLPPLRPFPSPTSWPASPSQSACRGRVGTVSTAAVIAPGASRKGRSPPRLGPRPSRMAEWRGKAAGPPGSPARRAKRLTLFDGVLDSPYDFTSSLEVSDQALLQCVTTHDWTEQKVSRERSPEAHVEDDDFEDDKSSDDVHASEGDVESVPGDLWPTADDYWFELLTADREDSVI